MPITDSAKKALRQNKRRRVKNVSTKRVFKSAIKTIRELIAGKKIEEAKKHLSTVFQKLDKAAKSGVIKKNTARRLKSRLSQRINALSKAAS
jgi:small subunit ribosomal protein S20